MSPETALRQAHMTARDYAIHAVSDLCVILGIDRREAGWTEKLAPFAPVLAAMVKAAAMDFDTAAKADADERLRDTLERSLRGLAENVRLDHPLMGQTLDGIASALGEIASAIGLADLERRRKSRSR
jgi:hypothetical protein